MEYSNVDLSDEQTGLSSMKLPEVCMPVYKEIVKEMTEVIKDAQMRDIFYSLSTGGDMQTVSKKTGITPRNLAYMYKKQANGSVWSGNLILCGNRNWITHMSDVEITSHFC